jgi:hypothetical protein
MDDEKKIILEHEIKVQDETYDNKRAVQYFSQISIISFIIMFNIYQLLTLHECSSQVPYMSLLTFLIGLLCPNKYGYFKTAFICPIYDVISAVPVGFGTINASAVNIERVGITNTIFGTTNINSAYTLPNTASVVDQVMTCGSLGVANCITPLVTSFSSLYPYPTSIRSVTTGSGTRTLCATYTMTADITFTNASIFFPVVGSNVSRVGIYKGDLTPATLVGQTASSVSSSSYSTRALTLVVGQSLTCTIGQQIVISFTNGGSTSTTLGVSNLALAFITTSYKCYGMSNNNFGYYFTNGNYN